MPAYITSANVAPWIVRKIFDGLALNEYVKWLPLDSTGFDLIVGPDLNLAVPQEWDRWEQNVVEAFPMRGGRYTDTLR